MPRISLTTDTVSEFTRRVEALRPDSQRKFGTMSIEQMLKHLRNATEVALGEVTMPDESKPIIRDILFVLIARVITTWPGGKIKAPAYWSPPPDHDFSGERAGLIGAMNRFVAAVDTTPDKVSTHPILGPLTLQKWSELMGVHIHHHMRQFGV
jgi:hypothetical protein